MNSLVDPITLRRGYADDHAQLARLAMLDSAAGPPAGPVLLAEVDGELRAALSLCDGSAVADPFFPTRHIVELLSAHAAAIATPRIRTGRIRTGRRRAPARAVTPSRSERLRGSPTRSMSRRSS